MILTKADISMTALGLKGASMIGLVSALTLPNEPQFYVLCATLITAVSGIVAQMLRDRAADRKADRDEMAERLRRSYELERTEQFRSYMSRETRATQNRSEELHTELSKNTRLVEVGISKTAEVADATSKLATATAVIISPALAAKIDRTTTETNDTAHRIEEKL